MKPVTALIIMDGFGYSPKREHNAIAIQGTPNITELLYRYPHTNIHASGMDVGLPDGQMGNSEVGHLNIGAGRIVYQELTRISKSIKDGDFFSNPALTAIMEDAKDKTLHIMGLLSDGGVHSHINHLFALIDMAKSKGVSNVKIHCFLDGRDVPPSSGKDFVLQLEGFLKERGYGLIATVMGRYYAMDRDKRWDRVKRAYDAIALGEGVKNGEASAAVQSSYDIGETDEFMQPAVIGDYSGINEGDGIIFFNFRPDRAREITRAFIESDFSDFERAGGYKQVSYVSMTQYDETFTNLSIAFPPEGRMANTLGAYLASKGLKQLRIAETEKSAHVTFFFNGGEEEPNPGEDRILIPSPKEVATYDQKPEMSAYQVTEKVIECIKSGKYDVIIMNYANCDMVGHTGVEDAVIKAVEAVDVCVGKVVEAIKETGGSALITADHGNAEKLVDEETGEPFTAHTTNEVVLIVADEKLRRSSLRIGGRLADIAPTLLDMMKLPKPDEMTGESLIVK